MEDNTLGNKLNIDKNAEQKLLVDTKKFVIKGTKLINSPQSRDQIIASLKTGNPLESVANTTVSIVQRLDEASRQAGDEVNDLVRIQGAHELLNQIADIGVASGAFNKLSQEQITTSFSVAVQNYIKTEIQAGRIDPKALEAEVTKNIKNMPPDEQQVLQNQISTINQTAIESNPESTKVQEQPSMLGNAPNQSVEAQSVLGGTQ